MTQTTVSSMHVMPLHYWTTGTYFFRILHHKFENNIQSFLYSILITLTHYGLMTPYGNYRYESTMAHVMACCLTAPSHYLNQCWFLISKDLCHQPESNFTVSALAGIMYHNLVNYTFKIIATSPRSHRVNQICSLILSSLILWNFVCGMLVIRLFVMSLLIGH